MRTLLIFALLAPSIALGAPRKVTVPAKGQVVEQAAKEKGSAKASSSPLVKEAPAAAKAKPTTKAVEAPGKR